MMRLSEAAGLLNVAFTGADAEVLRVSTDSRNTQPGDLFIALRGEKFDGGVYAARALQQGAVGVVLDSEQAPEVLHAIRVPDTRIALGQLAAGWRNRFAIPIVAITGSNGKTTVKEMLAGILRVAAASPHSNSGEPTSHSTMPACGQVGGDPPQDTKANGTPSAVDAVLATEGNFNNDIGLPLMLLKLRETHQYAVLEMGMNHFGEIDYLTRLARPDVALINNAQAAHVGMLGSVAGIARAKGEIFNGLSEHGIAIINADDAHAGMWREANAGRSVLSFGLDQEANVRGEFKPTEYGSALTVTTTYGRFDVDLQVPGSHNVRNALAASAAALALLIPSEQIGAGLSAFTGVKGRLQQKRGVRGSRFIDDTYNANPDSVLAALKVLSVHTGKKILVLGEMGELGDEAAALHAEMGLAARLAGVEKLFGLGDMTRDTVDAFGTGGVHCAQIEALLAVLEKELGADTVVLVKGSRFMQMERVVHYFMETH